MVLEDAKVTVIVDPENMEELLVALLMIRYYSATVLFAGADDPLDIIGIDRTHVVVLPQHIYERVRSTSQPKTDDRVGQLRAAQLAVATIADVDLIVVRGIAGELDSSIPGIMVNTEMAAGIEFIIDADLIDEPGGQWLSEMLFAADYSSVMTEMPTLDLLNKALQAGLNDDQLLEVLQSYAFPEKDVR